MKKLVRKNSFLTGGSSGIGLSTARLLAAEETAVAGTPRGER